MLSRAKPAVGPTPTAIPDLGVDKKIPRLETFIANRDYTGAITLLEVKFNYSNFKC